MCCSVCSRNVPTTSLMVRESNLGEIIQMFIAIRHIKCNHLIYIKYCWLNKLEKVLPTEGKRPVWLQEGSMFSSRLILWQILLREFVHFGGGGWGMGDDVAWESLQPSAPPQRSPQRQEPSELAIGFLRAPATDSNGMFGSMRECGLRPSRSRIPTVRARDRRQRL
jgi:hypothetical protein